MVRKRMQISREIRAYGERLPSKARVRRLGWAFAAALMVAPVADAAATACAEVEVTPDWVEAVQAAQAEARTDELLRLYKDLAAAGDPRMQADLGFLVEDGAGDFTSEQARARAALGLYKSAALCGDHLAIQRLALAYMSGELGLDADAGLAACLYRIELGANTAAVCGIGRDH